jgi:type IV pilus assembly protein PilQ
MVRSAWIKPLLALPILLFGLGHAAAQQPEDGCLARLPGDRVTLNLREANIQTTLRLLAQQYRVNMVVTDDVKGTVTLDFFRVPAREVFQSIIDAGNLRCVVAGEVLRVSSVTRVRAEEDERNKARDAQLRLEADTRRKIIEAKQAEDKAAQLAARGPVREEIIRLRYADAEEVARTLSGILGIRAGGGGFTAPVPLPQLSQLYSPSPPVNIPSTPPPPTTLPAPEQPLSPEAVAEGLTVGFYKKTNSVFIRYYARDLERINRLVREYLDIPTPQIQIAAQMVITTLHNLEQIGVQWGGGGSVNVGGSKVFVGQGFTQSTTGNNPIPPVNPPTVGNLVNLPTTLLPTLANGLFPGAGLLLGLVGSNFNINLAIQALEVQGKARILAAPKTVTVENATATISRGFEVPFVSTPTTGVSQVQFKEALLRLEVTPRLIRGDDETKIQMKVVFDNDNPDFSPAIQVAGNPPIFKRHQTTEVVIREGQRLVIGGVTNDQAGNTVRQVPALSKIPVLGYLFKSREVSGDSEELIVIITPSVVTDSKALPKR